MNIAVFSHSCYVTFDEYVAGLILLKHIFAANISPNRKRLLRFREMCKDVEPS